MVQGHIEYYTLISGKADGDKLLESKYFFCQLSVNYGITRRYLKVNCYQKLI